MAPERISGGMYSYPSDLWSFGLAVMACAIGKLPVPTKDGYWGVVHAVQEQPSPRLQDYGDHFSPEFCDFLDQCLHKNPLLRPSAAGLLAHPFITKNYSPREHANGRLSRDCQPPSAEALEHSRQEMRTIAEKAQSWCRDHVDAFRRLSYISKSNEVQDTSNGSKIMVLAKQLRLPVDEVARHFAFLDEYYVAFIMLHDDVVPGVKRLFDNLVTSFPSGALTSRSISFKFGLREGYNCADSDFVLYAFPELLEGEKPHSVIATCNKVDGGEEGYGEERSLSSYKTPSVKECNLLKLPYSNRKYRYELIVFRSGENVRNGSFITPKVEGNPFDYRVVFASCADEVSDPKVFEEIKKEKALLFLHTGDLHYHNLAVNNVAAFRDGYDSIFASPAGRAMLAMDVPFAYMWDDHDFGPDNSDSTAPGRNASVQAYREFVPHYPLIGGRSRMNTVHQAFTIGRVRYILTDLRSARTPNTAPAAPTKTVLGKKQKAWFKSELVRATSDPDIRLIIWVNTMPWLDDERKWGHFGHEQQELVNFIKGNGLNKWVPIVIVSGDAHMLAVDDGSHSPGNLTVLHAAALGRPGSIKGGPYSHGAFPGPGQYAVMDVTDEGGKDGRVCLYYRGMNIYKGMLIEFDTCHPERTPPVTPYYPPPIPVRIMMRICKKAKRYTGFMAIAAVAIIALLVYRSRRQRAINTKKHN
ncbi:hypothetical protein DD238_007900 [Peronospora effusa]|uniref:Protein kinase domain-containing protein n=1 Tax=Peronospora effusa TaxID=542832 RepID=A0A3M6VP16_9STRA|nr:hypothetical protein DD238_007900 [Peronospora effusa]